MRETSDDGTNAPMVAMIAEVDPGSERDLADAAALLTAYGREVLGAGEPPFEVDGVKEMLRTGRDDVVARLLLARDGDRPVGISLLELWTGHGNEHAATMHEHYVVPSHRRRGIGRALLEANAATARAAGRTLVLGAFNEGNGDGEAFAHALGLRVANTERQNRVAVADLDRDLLESWNRPAAGYSLVRFETVCPDELLEDYLRMHAVMNDAPRTESLDDFVFTAEHRRSSEAYDDALGIESWFVGARHDATGELAGLSEMAFRPWQRWLVDQEATAVAAPHRGHGIGRWLKAVNALRVLDDRPDARVIQTWNDGSNRWMLAINDAMGFRPVAQWIEVELDL